MSGGSEARNAGQQNFNHIPDFLQNHGHHPLPQVNVPPMSSQGMASEGWAADFTNMHITPQRHQVNTSQGWENQFLQANMPTTSTSMGEYVNGSQPSVYMNNTMQQSLGTSVSQQNTLSKQASDDEAKLFEAAFSNVQMEIDQQSQPEVLDILEEQPKEAPLENDENAEISKIANHIVQNIDRKNEKLKSSNFMMLMQQLSDKQARLEGDRFVNESGVDLRNTQISLEPIQQKAAQSSTAEHSSIPLNQNTESRLPDPLSFIDDSTIDFSQNKAYSALEFARLLTNEGIPHPSNWEERY